MKAKVPLANGSHDVALSAAAAIGRKYKLKTTALNLPTLKIC